MAIAFNGTSNFLKWAGAIRSDFPITIFCWARRANTNSDQFVFGSGSATALFAIRTIGNQINAQAFYMSSPGYSADRTRPGDTEFGWSPMMAVLTNDTIRMYYSGSDVSGSSNPGTYGGSLSSHTDFVVGGSAIGGGIAQFIGEISDLAIWNTALGDSEWATLKTGTPPEGVASGSLIEAWPLRELGEYTGVNGRTLVATGTLARSSTDPFVRSSPAATATTLSGPASGTNGVASANFTVGANGTITGTVTVTPADAANGGTFTPTTVAISSGTPTATFTYTPASAGSKTISISDNGGLTDAASLTYTSNAASVTATGSLASMSLVAPTSSATGSAAATGSLSGIAIVAPTASATVGNIATGSLASIQLSPPAAIATGSASATGSIRSITLAAPTATASSSVSGSGTLTFPLTNNTGTLLSGETGATVHVYTIGGTHIVTKTGQTTNGSGVMIVTDPLIVAATQYRIIVVLASGDEGLDKVTAS